MLNRLALTATLLASTLIGPAPAWAAEDSDAPPDALSLGGPENATSFGYSLGTDPRTWQYNSGVFLRTHPWGSNSEAMLGINGRSQAIAPDQTYAIESSGLSAALGAQAWFLRLGVSAEVMWLKRVVQNEGKLSFQHSPGFMIEPYVGTTLPFFQTPFTTLDARVYVPVGTFVPALASLGDPAFGPRVMLTLWVGMPSSPDEEEEEGGQMEVPDEGPVEDEGDEEIKPAPAPQKPITPARPQAPAKPVKPAAPAKPVKPKK